MDVRKLLFLCAIALAFASPHYRRAEAAASSPGMSGVHEYRYIVTGVDLTTTASIPLVPVQARKWITTGIKLHYKTVTSLTIVASASLGTNSASFNNLMAITVVGVNTAVADTIVDLTTSLISTAVDCTTNGLTLKITTGATATTALADVDVRGYWGEP